MMKVFTKAKYIELLSRFVSVEETRYYLCGVCFQPHPEGGVLAIATDGHRLGAIHDADGTIELGAPKEKAEFGADNSKELLVPIGKGMRKALKETNVDNWFVWKDGLSSIVNGYGQRSKGSVILESPNHHHEYIEHQDLIDGTFPDWRRVVPKKEPETTTRFDFNADYLANFHMKNMNGVTIFGAAKHEPCVVRIASMPEFLGVLMPMHLSNYITEQFPAWYSTLDKKAA